MSCVTMFRKRSLALGVIIVCFMVGMTYLAFRMKPCPCKIVDCILKTPEVAGKAMSVVEVLVAKWDRTNHTVLMTTREMHQCHSQIGLCVLCPDTQENGVDKLLYIPPVLLILYVLSRQWNVFRQVTTEMVLPPPPPYEAPPPVYKSDETNVQFATLP